MSAEAELYASLKRRAVYWSGRYSAHGHVVEVGDLISEGWLAYQRSRTLSRAEGAMRDFLRQRLGSRAGPLAEPWAEQTAAPAPDPRPSAAPWIPPEVPGPRRTALLLRAAGLSYAEIAQRMNSSRDQVRTMLFRSSWQIEGIRIRHRRPRIVPAPPQRTLRADRPQPGIFVPPPAIPNQMPARRRRVLELKAQGLTHSAIAAEIGTAREWVGAILHRSERQLEGIRIAERRKAAAKQALKRQRARAR